MPFSFLIPQPTLFSSQQHTPTHWINSIGLFLALWHDRKHIVPYLLGLVACSACVVASFCVEAAVQAFMNELSLRQRLGDGTDPTVMSLQRQWEERELYETSHSFFRLSVLFSPLCPLPASLVLWWVHITGWWLIPPLRSPTRDAPLLSSPAPSCPAQPCLFQPHRLWPQSQKSQFHAHALAHRRRGLLI